MVASRSAKLSPNFLNGNGNGERSASSPYHRAKVQSNIGLSTSIPRHFSGRMIIANTSGARCQLLLATPGYSIKSSHISSGAHTQQASCPPPCAATVGSATVQQQSLPPPASQSHGGYARPSAPPASPPPVHAVAGRGLPGLLLLSAGNGNGNGNGSPGSETAPGP